MNHGKWNILLHFVRRLMQRRGEGKAECLYVPKGCASWNYNGREALYKPCKKHGLVDRRNSSTLCCNFWRYRLVIWTEFYPLLHGISRYMYLIFASNQIIIDALWSLFLSNIWASDSILCFRQCCLNHHSYETGYWP